jgi:hypothetical protein
VPLDVVLAAIRSKTDRKIYPANEPAIDDEFVDDAPAGGIVDLEDEA